MKTYPKSQVKKKIMTMMKIVTMTTTKKMNKKYTPSLLSPL
jgi:hypothetical protein